MTARPAPQPALRPAGLERLLSARLAINWEVAAYAAILFAAFALRFWDLGSRALHHDESIHAQWSWGLLQGNYNHSPVFHGPFYYHIQGLVFFLFGASDYTSRVSAAIFGTALVALPLLMRRRLGAAGTLAAVALIAFSPTLVYYSRFFREDIYMGAFTLLMVVAMWRYIDEGRQRWLFVFAAGFTGNVLTKEGSFLAFAVFLVYLDVYLANQLAVRTLAARELDTLPRRILLTVGFAPWAWIVAAIWPFAAPLRRNLDWGDDLPRGGDVLLLLGTFTLPLLTPVSRTVFLEKLGLIEKDRLSWEKSLQGAVATRDAIALFGLFAVTTSIAAFAGLQWKPRVWGIAFAASAFVYLSLMTSLWTNLDGLISGPWGSLDYWYSQQDAHRGDQPWFYYYMLMPAYEFLPLVLVIGGAWWSVVRGDAFSRFLVVWLIGIWGALSWGAEKMPWLNVHIALPACILAAWTVQRAWQSWSGRVASRKTVATLGSTALLAAGGLALVAFLPGGLAFHLLRGAVALAVVAGVLFAAWPLGRSATAFVTVAAVIGALTFFSLRTMVMVVYERGDVPKDLLIYTQSSPQLKDVADQINALAAASGQGYNLPIAVDTADSFAWPWAWYLRDFKSVSYADFSNGPPAGNFSVMLVAFGNVGRAQDYAASNSSVQYGSPQRYPHRWWYDETYKYAMSVDNGQACLSRSGNCGPFRLETWKVIGNGIFGGGWLDAWFHYWRDHSPDRQPGSTDAFAFFPANFDLETGKLSARPIEPPGPGTDNDGRPSFGSLGSLPGQFFAPVDVEADADGNLYVIDSATKKLQKFDPQGNFITSIDIRNNAADSGEQSQPWGLGIGPDGEVVVADTFGWRVRVFDKDLELRASFGDPPDTSKAPGPFDLFGPRDAAIDRSGNVWVTDTGNDRIQVFTLDGQFVRTIGSSGSGPGQFDEPVGIDIGPDGAIYVADMYNSRVQVLNPDGTYRAQFTVEGWGGIEVNDKPYLRVLSDGRVAASVPSLNLVRILGTDGALSATISSESEPLNRPYGMVESADGKLWIAEGGAARLRLFDIP